MGKQSYFNQSEFERVISDYEEKKARFKFVVGKLIDFKKSQAQGKTGYRTDLAAIERQAQEEYQQTFDDSAFDKLEQFKKENSAASGKNVTKERALDNAAREAAAELSRADAVAAEAGSQAWMRVADEALDNAEQAVMINMMMVLYIRLKMNNGNYSERSFLADVDMNNAKTELERIYKEKFLQINAIKEIAICNFPKIPQANVLNNSPLRILDILNDASIGTAGHPWKSVTVENLVREV